MMYDGIQQFTKDDENSKKKRVRFISHNNPEINYKDQVITKTINYMKPYVIGLCKKKKRKHMFLTKECSKKMITFNHASS